MKKDKSLELLFGGDIFKGNFSSGTLQFLYYQNKNKIVPFLIIVVCFFLFLQFILPQVTELLNSNNEDLQLKQRVLDLQTEYNMLNNFDDSDLSSKLNTVSLALPPGKDYAAIINSVSQVSVKSGVSLSDFSFAVGDLSTKSAVVTSSPSIPIDLSIKGNISSILNFLKNLNQQFPLSDVVSVQMNQNSASIRTNFYYKPFPPMQMTGSFKPLSEVNIDMINTLSSFGSNTQSNIPFNMIDTEEMSGTSSANSASLSASPSAF